MNQKSKRPSLAVVIAVLALFVALGGPSYAAKMVTGKQIKNNSVTGKDIKNRSLTAADLKPGVIKAVAIPRKRVTATPGPSAAAAQAAAPEVLLHRTGQLSIYGKCWTDTSTSTTEYATFIKSSVNYAVFDSRDQSQEGGPNFEDFLNPSTLEVDRQLESDDSGTDDATLDSQDESDFTAFAPDGTALRGWTGGAAKNGTLAGGNGVYGPGDVCFFTGGIFVG
jgi:hypothetical protein